VLPAQRRQTVLRISVVSRSYEPPLAVRATMASPTRMAIGAAASCLVNDGDTVIIDAGTTTLELAKALLGRVAFSTVAPLPSVDLLVTDAPADHPTVLDIAAAGVDITEAKVVDAQ
jgi:DeoR/GlpR family transcriptional regulator of sugar metabolism